MNKLLASVGAVALLAVLVLGVTLPKSDTPLASQGPKGEQGVQGPAGSQGPQGPQGPAGPAGQSVQGLQSLLSALQGLLANLSSQPAPQKFGAFPGPVLDSPYLTVNGATTYLEGKRMNTGTATLAVFKLPRATSTVEFACQTTTSTGTALYLIATLNNVPFSPPLAAATSSSPNQVVLNDLSTSTAGLVPANLTTALVFSATTTTATQDRSDLVTSRTGTTTESRYLVIHAKNAGGGQLSNAGTGTVVSGRCRAEFKEL